jgi:hypothetical protein
VKRNVGRLVDLLITMKTYSVSIKRAMKGAVLANFAKAAGIWIVLTFLYPGRTGYIDNNGVAFLFAISGIPSSAFAGAVIALVIRGVNSKAGIKLGPFGRAAVGASLLCATSLLFYYYDKYFPGKNRWSADNPSSWIVWSIAYGDFGIVIGSIAGVMATRKTRNGSE